MILRRTVSVFLAVCIACAGLLSCERAVVVADYFEPSLEIVNLDREVRTGDDFRFRITSNHDRFVLDSWQVDRRCGVDGTEIAIGREYMSGEVLVVRSMPVEETHKGFLTVRLTDPVTGFSKEISSGYTAYSVAEASLEVLTPSVTSGGQARIRVYCSHDSFEVKSVASPFSFDGLVAGKSFTVNSDGYVDFVANDVLVTENGDKEIRLVLADPESGSMLTVTGVVSLRKPTVVSMVVCDYDGVALPVLYDGQDIYIRVYDTQSSFVVEDFFCEFGSVMNIGSSCSVSSLGFYQVALRGIRVVSDHEGVVNLVLRDPVSGESFRLSCPYSARKEKN